MSALDAHPIVLSEEEPEPPRPAMATPPIGSSAAQGNP